MPGNAGNTCLGLLVLKLGLLSSKAGCDTGAMRKMFCLIFFFRLSYVWHFGMVGGSGNWNWTVFNCITFHHAPFAQLLANVFRYAYPVSLLFYSFCNLLLFLFLYF